MSNLAPGCTSGDIERAMGVVSQIQAAEEWVLELLAERCRTPAEYRLAIMAGVAAMEASRQPPNDEMNVRVSNAFADRQEIEDSHAFRTDRGG